MVVAKQPSSWLKGWPWFVLLLIVIFAMAIRTRVADMPLERDEGEYAYAGQLIRQGIPPYKLAYNMKLPGTYVVYAGIMAVFGETARGIHIGTACMVSLTVILIFLLGRTLFDTTAGLVAAASFAILSASHSMLGLAAHANHFVTLFSVAGLLVLLLPDRINSPMRCFWGGILMGIAFLMKQQGALFIVMGGLTIIWRIWTSTDRAWKGLIRPMGLFAIASLIPFAISCVILWRAGVFEKFWFWTFRYAKEYASALNLSAGIETFSYSMSSIVEWIWPLLILAGLGVLAVFVIKEDRQRAVWLVAFFVLSFGSVSVGLYYRTHYFLLMLPVLSLFIGILISGTQKLLPKTSLYQAIPVTFFIAAFVATIAFHYPIFFRLPAQKLVAAIYPDNPFTKTDAVGQYIRSHSPPNARLAVLGSEPEIYFSANRRSATGYIYTYGLMEAQPFALQMQKEMIQEIETAAPQFLVIVKVYYSWLGRANSPQLIFDWLGKYSTTNYHPVGVVDFVSPFQPTEVWGAEAANYQPRAENFMVLLERNPEPAKH